MKVVIFCGVVVMGVVCSPANSAELGPSGIVVYRLASRLSKLPIPDRPPEMHAVPHDELIKTAGCRCPSIKALQRGNDIFLDETLDMTDIQNIAVLLHEFVHHLQWANAGPAAGCREWVDREIVAYQLQNEMLYRAGAHLAQPPPFPECR